MKIQKIAIGLTVINLFLMIFLMSELSTARANKTNGSPFQILRGSGLEIIDSKGKTRASITMNDASTVNGEAYPPSIVFRLIDEKGQPVAKMDASSAGGGISLSEPTQSYVQILARSDGSLIKIKNKNGKEQTMKP